MDVSSFLGGNYLSQTDLQQPWQVCTISGADSQLVGQGPQADQKICVSFNEHSKPLGLNKTNLRRVAELYGTDSTNWIGKQLLVYRSATTFAGEPKLCVRVCGPQQAPPDTICNPQGNAVAFVPIAPAAPVAVQQPSAPQQPVAAPQPPAPWEQNDNSPPAA